MKFKRCVLHPFFFFFFEFQPESAGLVLVQLESVCFGSFDRYRPIWRKSAQVDAYRETEKKKKKQKQKKKNKKINKTKQKNKKKQTNWTRH